MITLNNRSVKYNCAVDDGSRVLANAQVTQLANNSPAVCAAHCAAGGYRYAGVEYGNECQCGTGYRNGVPPQAVGSWGMQLKFSFLAVDSTSA